MHIDMLVIGIVGVAACFGFLFGGFKQLTLVFGMAVGYAFSHHFAEGLAPFCAKQWHMSPTIVRVILTFGLFTGVGLLTALVTRIAFRRLISMHQGGKADRIIGLVLAACQSGYVVYTFLCMYTLMGAGKVEAMEGPLSRQSRESKVVAFVRGHNVFLYMLQGQLQTMLDTLKERKDAQVFINGFMTQADLSPKANGGIDVQSLLNDPRIQTAINTGDTSALVNSPEFQQLLNDPEIQKLLTGPEVQGLIGVPEDPEKAETNLTR